MPMLHIISRSQARQFGLKHYFTGNPCKYRQYAERRVTNKQCTCFLCEAVQLSRMKNWRKEHPQHVTKWRKSKRVQPHNPTFITINKNISL